MAQILMPTGAGMLRKTVKMTAGQVRPVQVTACAKPATRPVRTFAGAKRQ
jgi:hypothetical protein